MGYGFKAGGGGSNPLNFKVVGGTSEPVNPKENTIWINTDKNITSWLFSATEPTEPAEGLVWIYTGTESQTAFNSLKENTIMVYPISAKQYVSGAWVDVTAKSYQGGKWVKWVPEGALYYYGNEMTEKTGGWKATSGTITKNDGYFVVNQNSVCSTTNKVSTVGYKTITVKAKTYARQWFGFGNANSSFTVGQTELPQGSVGTVSIDLTSIQGSYYPIFACGTDIGANIEVYEVVMTK